jgi:hypothetical protein
MKELGCIELFDRDELVEETELDFEDILIVETVVQLFTLGGIGKMQEDDDMDDEDFFELLEVEIEF